MDQTNGENLANKHYQLGRECFYNRNFAHALSHFRKSYHHKPDPRLLPSVKSFFRVHVGYCRGARIARSSIDERSPGARQE